MVVTGWPKYFKDRMIIGDPNSHVAICCLWTVRLLIASYFEEDWQSNAAPTFAQSENMGGDKQLFKSREYTNIGSLVSKQGLSFIIRNLLANTNIRYLVVCGYDRSKTGKYINELWQGGVDQKNVSKLNPEVKIDEDIPQKSIERVLKNVRLINLVGKWDRDSVLKAVRGCKKLPDYGQTEEYDFKPVAAKTYPAEATGIRIEGKYVADCWLRILKEIMDYGWSKSSKYGEVKERFNLVAVISDEDPDKPVFAPYFKFTKKELSEYLPEIMTSAVPEGLHYTYGHRYREYFGVNQIQVIIDSIKNNKDTRRAVAFAYDPRADYKSTNAPCITDVMANVLDDKVYLTVHIRSNDMFGAWPRNAFGFRMVQKEIAKATNLMMGDLTIVSTSAHIYEPAFREIEEILRKYYKNEPACRFDPRGNFAVFVKNGRIIAKHISPDGIELRVFEAVSAIDMYRKILAERAISDLQHAMDLGAELGKAETALKNGLVYIQDNPLKITLRESQ